MVITGVTQDDGYKGAAAKRAEKRKNQHYNSHIQACRKAGSTDKRLDIEMVPLAIETMGATGEEMQELSKVLKRSFETAILPKDDSSAAADFNNTWVYRLSTTVQRGTADIIYNVTQNNRAPLSTIRIAKDGQLIETITRDGKTGGGKGRQQSKTTTTTKSKPQRGNTTVTLNTKPTACRRSCRNAPAGRKLPCSR